VRERLADAIRTGERKKDIKATVVVGGGGEVIAARVVSCPSLPRLGGVKRSDKLAGRWNGVGGKAKGDRVQAMPGGERGVGGPESRMYSCSAAGFTEKCSVRSADAHWFLWRVMT
jgi:hypothetical protein